MAETPKEEKAVVNTEKKDCGYGDFRCSNILLCKYPLHEVIRALFFKCFGFETSDEPAAVGCPQSSTTEPVPLTCPSSSPGPTGASEDITMRFRPPPKLPPSKGSGPETNSSGN